MGKVQVGSRVTRIQWLNTPDKYRSPRLFNTLEDARAYDTSAVISLQLQLNTPDNHTIELEGGVSTADTIWRVSPSQEPGVLPALDAQLTTIEGKYPVFTNPDGGVWVLITPSLPG
jgi:hypothetical protein